MFALNQNMYFTPELTSQDARKNRAINTSTSQNPGSQLGAVEALTVVA